MLVLLTLPIPQLIIPSLKFLNVYHLSEIPSIETLTKRVKEEEEKEFLIPLLGAEVTGRISGRIIHVSNRY